MDRDDLCGCKKSVILVPHNDDQTILVPTCSSIRVVGKIGCSHNYAMGLCACGSAHKLWGSHGKIAANNESYDRCTREENCSFVLRCNCGGYIMSMDPRHCSNSSECEHYTDSQSTDSQDSYTHSDHGAE